MILSPSTSSGLLTATALITTIPGRLHAIDVVAGTAGTTLLKVYDNNTSSTSGATLLLECFLTASATQSLHINSTVGRAYQKGLYAVLSATTTDSSYVVGYCS